MSTEAERKAWAKRIREAERIAQRKRYHPPEEKVKWLSTTCPHCEAKVKYSPKPGFKGELYWGTCGKKFTLTMLDQFTITYEEVEE